MRPELLLVRGFLLEAMFHYAGRQRLGFFWALRRPWPGKQTPIVNANPTLAGYALGWADREGTASVATFHRSLFPVLGSLGDRLIYGMLRPIATLAALFASAFGPIPAAVVLLLVYNPPEIYLRWRSIRTGQAGAAAVARDLSQGGICRATPVLTRVLACALGLVGGFWAIEEVLQGRLWNLIAAALLFPPLYVLLRRRVGVVWLPVALAALAGVAFFVVCVLTKE